MDSNPIGFCEREGNVVTTVMSGASLPDDLAKHVRSCAVCSAALEVASQLALLAASEMADPLPSASLMLWRASLRGRQTAGRKSEQILRWCGWCTAAVLLLTTGAIAPATLGNLPGSGNVFGIGLAVLTCILTSSGIALALWHQFDR